MQSTEQDKGFGTKNGIKYPKTLASTGRTYQLKTLTRTIMKGTRLD